MLLASSFSHYKIMFLRKLPAYIVGIVIVVALVTIGLSIQSSFLPGFKNSLVGDFFVHSRLTLVKESSPLLHFSNRKPAIQVRRSMKITFRQSGGYTGLIKGCEIDTDLLPSDESTLLQALVEQSGLLKAEGRQLSDGRDLLDYEITIEIGHEVHHVSFDNMSLPAEVIPLLEYLQGQAKPRSL
jgi:hypothetical protein